MKSSAEKTGLGFFSLIWSGYFISALGSALVGFALGVTVFQETGSVSRYTLIGLSSFLPGFFLSPIAGVVADRFDRRFVLITAGVCGALCNVAMYQVVMQEPLNVWKMYAIVMAAATCTTFVWPAFMAITTLIVHKEHLGRATGLARIGGSVSGILSPTLAAILLETIELRGIVLLNLVSYLVPVSILLLVRLPKAPESEEGKEAKGSFWHEAISGWKFIRQRDGLLQLLLTFAFANFCVSMVQILLTPLVLGFASPLGLGLVVSFSTAGTMVGGILMAVWGGPERRIRAVFVILGANSLILLLATLEPNITLVASAAFFFVLGFPVIAGCTQVVWQRKVPPDLQGRVFAMRRLIAGSAMPVSLMIAGPLADNFFEPWMAIDGPLADSVGRLIGVGPGRGIALLFLVMSVVLAVLVVLALRSRRLMNLEDDIPDAIPDDESKALSPSTDALSQHAGLGRLSSFAALVLTAILVAGTVGSILLQRPPAAIDEAEPTAFSAGRAMRHVEAIAQEPRPIGSPALAEARDYLLRQLGELGLETQTQLALGEWSTPRLVRIGDVENVLARLPGNQSGEPPGAVLLVAHYDSVASSPGASDNAAAVATLLETARALVSGPPLRNDVIFLFSDGEEPALFGARAFVQRHPWAQGVGVVLNFDARGHGGPVFMFQSNEDNGGWIPHFIAGAPRPFASSLMNQVYERLPNQTDFRVFRDAGYAGFNFAFIEGLTHYHTHLDQIDDVDRRSVQHQGSYALGLTRYFGELDSEPETKTDRVFFNVAGPLMVHYPRWFAVVSAGLVIALFSSLVLLGYRRRRITTFGLVQGFLAALGLGLLIPVAITLLWMIVREAGQVPMVMGSTEGAHRFMIAFVALAFAIFVSVYRFLRQMVSVLNLAIGALVWWLIALIATSGTALPAETNFIITWPLAAGLLVVGYLLRTSKETVNPRTLFGLLAASGLVATLLIAPLAGALYVGLQSLFALGGGPLVLVVLLLLLLIPQLEVLTHRQGHRIAGAAAILGVAMLVFGLWNPGGSEGSRQNSIVYAVDDESDEQFWFTFDLRPDEWVRQFGFDKRDRQSFERFQPWMRRKLLREEAPASGLKPSAVEIEKVTPIGNQRQYHLRLDTPEDSIARIFWFEPPEAVLSAQIKDEALSVVGIDGKGPLLEYLTLDPNGEEMTLRVRGQETVTVSVVDLIDSLPEIPGMEPRPEHLLPLSMGPVLRSDTTLLRWSFDLPVVLPEPTIPTSVPELTPQPAPTTAMR